MKSEKKGRNCKSQSYRKITQAISTMTKVYNFFRINNNFQYISENNIQRLLVLSYGICQSKTVNISAINDEIDASISGRTTRASQYKWLIEAFQTGNIKPLLQQVFALIVGAFHEFGEVLQILIDRTNWDIGLRRVNILSLGMLYKDNIFMPLVHEDLGYKGNSDGETRLNLIKQLIAWWEFLKIPLPVFEIVGDREFIGEAWLSALEKLGIRYVIRLKSGLKFYEWLEQGMSGDKIEVKNILANQLKQGNTSAEIVIGGEFIVRVVGTRNEGKDFDTEPYIYLITNNEDISNAAHTYRKRWKIETCFKHLKSGGFNLEDMNLEFPHKTDILMAVLSLVYAMTIFVAENNCEIKDIPMQKFKNNKVFPRVSTFRLGKSIMSAAKKWEDFINIFLEMASFAFDKLLKNKILYINFKNS